MLIIKLYAQLFNGWQLGAWYFWGTAKFEWNFIIFDNVKVSNLQYSLTNVVLFLTIKFYRYNRNWKSAHFKLGEHEITSGGTKVPNVVYKLVNI